MYGNSPIILFKATNINNLTKTIEVPGFPLGPRRVLNSSKIFFITNLIKIMCLFEFNQSVGVNKKINKVILIQLNDILNHDEEGSKTENKFLIILN